MMEEKIKTRWEEMKRRKTPNLLSPTLPKGVSHGASYPTAMFEILDTLATVALGRLCAGTGAK